MVALLRHVGVVVIITILRRELPFCNHWVHYGAVSFSRQLAPGWLSQWFITQWLPLFSLFITQVPSSCYIEFCVNGVSCMRYAMAFALTEF
jgi:hypothetical protein